MIKTLTRQCAPNGSGFSKRYADHFFESTMLRACLCSESLTTHFVSLPSWRLGQAQSASKASVHVRQRHTPHLGIRSRARLSVGSSTPRVYTTLCPLVAPPLCEIRRQQASCCESFGVCVSRQRGSAACLRYVAKGNSNSTYPPPTHTHLSKAFHRHLTDACHPSVLK